MSKALGARRAFTALGYGALLGPAVGLIVSLLFPGSRKIVLLAMSLVFGLFFGPLLTLSTASMLAAAGVSKTDFAAAGWPRLILFGLLGCGLGIAVGFAAGTVLLRIITMGRVILFVFAMIGGIAGVLAAGSVLVRQAAKHRLAQ
ncbi:MAG TPA: hypothetical protein VGV35_06545 [Bryobacteraceae bacterium]|nr:hypothetical protein [Bryobacteraceae bacterium]